MSAGLEWTRTDQKGIQNRDGFRSQRSLKAIQAKSTVRRGFCWKYVLSDPHSYCVWISKKQGGRTNFDRRARPSGLKRVDTQSTWGELRAKSDDTVLARELQRHFFWALLPKGGKPPNVLIVAPDGILHLFTVRRLSRDSGRGPCSLESPYRKLCNRHRQC